MNRSFSERHGYSVAEREITIREDAPVDLRYVVAEIARKAGMSPHDIREVLCGVLFVRPDPNNWSAYPNVWGEVQDLLASCKWFKVYDVAEALWRALSFREGEQRQFEDELNRFFRERGIGWELKNPDGIVFRGNETFASVTAQAVHVLAATGRATASSEIHEALTDISRKPPDVTGAMQHAIAALECVARDVTGDSNATLGVLLPKLDLPKPLDTAVEKLWGFASNRARHVKVGNIVADEQAELTVTIACAICAFLATRCNTQPATSARRRQSS